MEDQLQTLLRAQILGIILGTVFLFIGLASCAIAVIRRGARVRILVWQGVFSAMYGARILAYVPPAFHLLPRSTWPSRDYVIWIITYLILIPGLFCWLELSWGKLRRLIQITLIAAALAAIVGICSIFITGSPDRYMPYNNVLGIWTVLVLAIVNVVPSLSKRFLLIQSRILSIGLLVFAATALHSNLKDFLHLPNYPALEPLGFAVLILSLGYVAADRVFADERRLLSIESELAVAREIQSSILPSGPPGLKGLRIHASYRPMTAVAGDFYDFIPVDQHRAGFLVADVSGHGVPAALIAAMIKVAMQSVVSCANDPAEVLRRLNHILSGQLRDQFVTAAYLWIDTQNHQALYSAAGHPPLLCWRNDKLERIESNGLVFGITANPGYPVRDFPLNSGDRFILCTDGILEPESAAGEFFGDRQLEQVIRSHHTRPPSELSAQLLSEIAQWRPAYALQQDDITLIIIDFL